ncbi:MAG: hypothetical protein QME42_00550 [bacterium]|nr:hypothetical protein [bacterium]
MSIKEAEVIDRIANHVNVAKDNLIMESLTSLLRERRRAILMDRLEIISRYGINNSLELEKKIEEGVIPEHPAWESLIEIENLEANLEDIEGDLQSLSKSG